MKIKHLYEEQLFKKSLTIKNGFVSCGDLHLSNTYAYGTYTEDGMSSRLLDIEKALTSAANSARRFNIPLIINGDILTSGMLDYHCENILVRFLIEFGDINIIINLGNHDIEGSKSVITPLLKLSKNKQHTVVTSPSVIHVNNMKFCVIPFDYNTEDIERQIKLIAKNLTRDKTNILVVHDFFQKAKLGGKRKTSVGINQNLFKTKPYNRYDFIVASHIHKFQQLCEGKGYYTSSIIPVDFGEKEISHGYQIVNISKNKMYFVVPRCPKFVTVRDDEILSVSKKKLSSKTRNNIVAIIITSNKNKAKEDEMREMVLKSGASFVTIRTRIEDSHKITKSFTSKPAHVDLAAFVATYSKKIAEDFNLPQNKVERFGMNIFENASKTINKELQKR